MEATPEATAAAPPPVQQQQLSQPAPAFKPYKPPGFRPPSLSIVTVTPEMQKSLQNLRNSSNATLENIVDGYDEDDLEDYDDDLDTHGHEEEHGRVGGKPAIHRMNRVEEDTEDEEEDEDENRFYYKTPTKEQIKELKKVNGLVNRMNGKPSVNGVNGQVVKNNNQHHHEGQQHNNQHNHQKTPLPNGGKQFESSLLRYVLPQQPNGNLLSPNSPNMDSVSAASFLSETRKLPSILKHSNSKDDIADDTGSIGDCSMNQSDNASVHHEHNQNMQKLMNYRMFKLLSIMYAILLLVIGAIVTIADMSNSVNDNDHLYSIITTLMGIGFLVFIHIDVQRHKSYVMKWEKKRRDAIEAPIKSANDLDSVSVTTAVIFNRSWTDDEIDDETKDILNSYKFLTGKHSGNFYLKIGMTLFCMGCIVHQGINVALQAHFYLEDVKGCENAISLTVYLVRCISAFYQLYMAFKYSNLIINRNHYLVMFGMMHLVGTSMSFWFSTIIEEAMDGYTNKVKDYHGNSSIPEEVTFKAAVDHQINCSKSALSTFESMDAFPYLYPFSIEYNIILASVWYIIWTNIGSNDPSQLHHVREEINQDRQTGTIDVNYRSNITINADCHASNLGLFGGLLTLLVILTTTIVFFTTIKHDEYHDVGIVLYTLQFGLLTLCILITTPLAMRQTRRLNVVSHHHLDNSATAMDDILLLVPLPFFYVHHTLCIYTEIRYGTANSIIMACIYVLHLVQVTWQTPFLMDGIRRCSNDRKLRFKKPGKGLITFAIIINVTMWILITFEIKSVDKYHSMAKYFGKFNWMVILDTCLPLMLFYRFHSSVCLSDIWQHGYEKDEAHH